MSKIKHPTTHEERMQFNVEYGLSVPVGERFWTLYVTLLALLTKDPIYGDKRWASAFIDAEGYLQRD